MVHFIGQLSLVGTIFKQIKNKRRALRYRKAVNRHYNRGTQRKYEPDHIKSITGRYVFSHQYEGRRRRQHLKIKGRFFIQFYNNPVNQSINTLQNSVFR